MDDSTDGSATPRAAGRTANSTTGLGAEASSGVLRAPIPLRLGVPVLLVLTAAYLSWDFDHFDAAVWLGAGSVPVLVSLGAASIRRLVSKTGAGGTFLATWVVVLALLAFGTYTDKSSGVVAPDTVSPALKQAVNNFAKTATGRAGDAVHTRSTQQVSSDPQADTAAVLNQISEVLARSGKHMRELIAAEKSLPLDQVLAPESLASREGVDHGREIIGEYSGMIDDYERTYNSSMDEMQRIIDAAPASVRGNLEAGFANGKGPAYVWVSAYVRAERGSIATCSEILDLAEANLGKTYVSNGQIYFPNSVLPTYQALVGQLRADSIEETRATKALVEGQQGARDQVASMQKEVNAR